MVRTVAAIIVAVILSILLLRGCEDPQQGRGEIDSLKAANRQLARDFIKLQAQDSIIKVKERQRADSFKVELRAREDRIARLKANPTIKEIRVAYPVVDTLIVEQDSVVNELKEELQVQAQERHRAEQRSMDRETNLQQENNNLEGINSSLEAFNRSQTKTIKWQKVELWAWRVGGGGILIWQAIKK